MDDDDDDHYEDEVKKWTESGRGDREGNVEKEDHIYR